MLYLVANILLLIFICVLIYLATLNGRYSIKHSQLINADIDAVFDKIRDFKCWAEWSPWLIHEPDAQLTFSSSHDEENGFYTWKGQRVGSGKLTHIKFERPHLINQQLEFIKPFKSICHVGFELSNKNGQTQVTWLMNGKMPFFLRFFTEKTKEMINKDYAFGLAMLNGVLDSKAEYPVLNFGDKITLDPVYSLCESFSGDIQTMEKTMKSSFPKLMSYAEQHGEITGSPFTAYHKVNLKTMQFVCDMAVPVSEEMDPGEYQLKKLGGGRYYSATLKGSYKFLELAWYSAYAHIHMLKLKNSQNRTSLEVYRNDPEQVHSSNDILTTLYIPIK